MEDDRFVQLALSRGFVTTEQVERARKEQKALADRGIDHGVYFLLQDLGFLRENDARELRQSISSTAIKALEVDGFVIQGRLGCGGMGDVFRANHPDGRKAAIKLLSSRTTHSEEYVVRFVREARAMQRLSHVHIVGVWSAGECMGAHYIVMELVEGPSLKSWMQDYGRLAPADALTLLRQMAAALGHAWRQGVLHRDVKPANILLGPPRPGHQEPFCAKLCDFGLARLVSDAGGTDLMRDNLTGTGLALGTPHYMSPEQACSERDIDQRADIYGLGATIYHALLGRTLHNGDDSAAIMYKQVTEHVDLTRLPSAGTDPALISLLGSMLERRRADRIADWDAVLARAEGRVQGPIAAPPAGPARSGIPSQPLPRGPAAASPALTAPIQTPRRRRWLGWMAALITAGALATAFGVSFTSTSSSAYVAADPANLSELLARPHGPEPRVFLLAPGRYQGPIRLGSAHRGLRLHAAGAEVTLTGSPAVLCESGLIDAEIEGIALESLDGPALRTTGVCAIQLRRASITGGVAVAGGVVAMGDVRIDGPVGVSDRGLLDITTGRISGRIMVTDGELRLNRCDIAGDLEVRSGSLVADGVRVNSASSPAVRLGQSRCTARDVQIASPGVGLMATDSEIGVLFGLTVNGPGPSILWSGPRQSSWNWQRFSLDSAPEGPTGPLPPGPGADINRLP